MEYSSGEFGSLSAFEGKPAEKGLPLVESGVEQSNPFGFAEAAEQETGNDSAEKNGGLNPGLGFENGPFS